jgi:plasmid stability protein
MASLQVRDFPTELYEELKTRAKQENRSISQQAVTAIREHVATSIDNAQPIAFRPPNSAAIGAENVNYIKKRKQLFAELEAMPKPVISPDFPNPVEMLHAAREERDDCIRL